ncbi:G-box-binding factor 1 [Acorus calamus]|uniref:G-box-binding factor 1 n=1 Tax=Acorus calamus TaxID=4465 RepID=A0AAV9DJQ3_ACOCL|nr:G-box-binding factor 1 [Acorus calamus]
MGSGENSAPVKPTNKAASASQHVQEIPTTPYSDWASMQAYYGAGASPSPFFQPAVASPPTPYMWTGQHFPPYGTPLPYPAMYPHGGMYSHPSMAPLQGVAVAATETEGKPSDAKDRASMKKGKGNTGNLGRAAGKSVDGEKAASSSANDVGSQSYDSGSDGSSDASHEKQQEFPTASKGGITQHKSAQYSAAAVETSFGESGQPAANLPVPVPGKPTNNIGMDLWNASSSGAVTTKGRPGPVSISPAIAPAPIIGREGFVADQQWVQDERELKRQKRKQSNRESARRSRLRKQAECDDLAKKVDALTSENCALKNELQQLSEECRKLTSENESITEKLIREQGPNVLTSIKGNNLRTSAHPSADGEGNGHR